MTIVRHIHKWIIFLLIIPACNNNQKTINSFQYIDIEDNISNMEIINLSHFTSNIKYVPLQSGENIYLSWISKCEFFKDFILISNLSNCLLFAKEGNFITKIGAKGRGPGEYQFAMSVAFDRDSNIYMQSLYDLIEYKIDGSFVKKNKNYFMLHNSMDEYFLNWIIINDSLLFGHIPNTTGLIESKALLSNIDGDITKTYKNYILFKREKTIASGFEDHANIYQFNNSIYYKEFYNDTLFCLNDQYNIIPQFAFNLGKYKEPVSERTKLPGQGNSMSKYLYIWNTFQTYNYLFIDCQFGDYFPAKRLTPKIINLPNGQVIKTWINTNKALGIYNKQTNSFSFCKPTNTDNPLYTSGIYNDIDAGPRFFPTKQVNDSTLIMWIKADELKNHIESEDFKNCVAIYPEKKKQLEILANNLSILDNPVLMIVTLKK